jgi:hypothetical protein
VPTISANNKDQCQYQCQNRTFTEVISLTLYPALSLPFKVPDVLE